MNEQFPVAVTARPAAPIPAGMWGRALRPRGRVLPGQAREHNRAAVLQALYSSGSLSRADIARRTGLTRVTVSDLVAELIDDHLVVELGIRTESRPGKPATLLSIKADAYHVVGIDLSDLTAVRVAVVDLDGEIIARRVTALDATGEAAIQGVSELAREAIADAGAPVLGVGVGTPGIVDAYGTVRTAPNLQWHDVPLQARLETDLGVPVQVVNDANAALMAEYAANDGADDMLLVKVGTGVGAGLVLDGVPRMGSHFAAGEIGHVVVGTDAGPPCACGKEGCLEAWLSAPNLRAGLAAIPAGDTDGRRAVLEQAGRRLGIVLAPVIGAVNTSQIVVSGPAELIGGTLLEATVATLRQRLLADFHDDLTIRTSDVGEEIVARGAIAVVIASRLGVS